MAGIIVGVDGSPNSQLALDWATREAALHRVPVTVLTVHEVATNHWTGSPISMPEDAAAVEQARLAAVDAAAKATSKLGDQPPSVTVRAVTGVAAQELIAASRDADQLVLGARGGGGFANLLLGSVTNQVVHHAHCPVTVVPAS